MTKLLSRLLIALALMAGIAPAVAQTFPTVPAQTVIGRLGQPGDTGPSQAIPFTTLRSQLHVPPSSVIYAADVGVKCDGTTDDATALQRAVDTAALAGNVQVILPAGTCRLNKTVFLNKFTTTGTLTLPGVALAGQGKGVTILDTRVANGYALAINPDWKAAHQSLFGITATTGGAGALATNTYYVQITVNDNSGNEVFVTSPKSIAVTGPGGRIAITLQPLNNGYSYNIYCSTSSTPANYCVIGGSTASAVGGGQTVNIDAVGASRVVPTDKIAEWQQVNISDLSITSTTNAAGASGVLLFKVGYSNLTNVYMHHLLGTGLDMPNYAGDRDGSFVVTVDKSKFDTIAGWCVNAAGNTLELSNFSVINSVFNICGTPPTNLNTNFTITSITNGATPVVTTSTPHTLQTNDQIYIQNVAGMSLATGWYRVTVLSGTTFNLRDLNGQLVNTTALGAYTASSGTESLSWRPPSVSGGVVNGSGGLSWTGLIGTFKNNGFTQNNNVAMYFSEAGSSDNATIEGTDFENTAGKGLYVASLLGGTLTNSECLATAGLGNMISCVQLGSGFGAGSVLNFKISNIKVRNDVTPSTNFEQFQSTNLTSTFIDTNRVSNVYWQLFDAAGQTRTNGFAFDPIPGQVLFSISATNVAQLIPIGYGGCLPIHLKANGEWICVKIANAGVTQGGIGGLSANTTYNFYAYNSAATSAPIVIAMEVSSAGVSLSDGYYVKTGDASRTFVGQAKTDGSGNFLTTAFQLSQYPIQVAAPLAFVGVGIGCPACLQNSGTAKGDTNYTILSTDRYVYTSAAFTAPRTWTLPAANSLPAGTPIWIEDAANGVTSTNTLSIARGGADTINGSASSTVLNNAGAGGTFITDGSANWGTQVQTVTTGGTGATTAAGARTNLGLTATAIAAAGQLPATATNDNATAGNLGESKQSAGKQGSTSPVTITIASPAVVTATAHGMTAALNNCTVMNFTTTGALPTGLVVGTNYYLSVINANTFNVSTSIANCFAGTFINTSGTQSGTQSAFYSGVYPAANVATDVAAVQVGAGDWLAQCIIYFDPVAGTSSTNFLGWTNNVAGTGNFVSGGYSTLNLPAITGTTLTGGPGASPVTRWSSASTQIIYCGGRSTFTGTAPTAIYGSIIAWRPR